jgi:hypothetical protein
MRHLLMDPAFPDMVREWASEPPKGELRKRVANDNGSEVSDIADPFLTMIARMEIAATRAW